MTMFLRTNLDAASHRASEKTRKKRVQTNSSALATQILAELHAGGGPESANALDAGKSLSYARLLFRGFA